MKTLTLIALYLLLVTPAVAAGKITHPEGMSLLVILFLVIVALIILLQFIPAVIMLGSMLKGAFIKTQTSASKKNGSSL